MVLGEWLKLKIVEGHVLKHVHRKYLRQFATPERLPNPIKSDNELLKWAEFYKKDCFISVFYFKEWDRRNPKKESVIIDTIYFDFDHETKPKKLTQKLDFLWNSS